MDLIINNMCRNTNGNVVITIHWIAIKAEGDYEASTYGTVNLREKSPDEIDFVQYENITKEIAIEWLKDALGDEKIKAIDKSLDAVIIDLKSPQTAFGLPWEAE